MPDNFPIGIVVLAMGVIALGGNRPTGVMFPQGQLSRGQSGSRPVTERVHSNL